MRGLEKVKKFIIENKKKQNYVFYSQDIPLSIRTYLGKEKMIFSPIRGIYILKKSDTFESEAILEHKWWIISRLWWIISGTSAALFYSDEIKNISKYKIITKNKNFETYIGESKSIFVKFIASSVPRITQKVLINWEKVEIETLLSLVINDFSLVEKHPKLKKKLLEKEINSEKIETLIKKKFKISGISKLAIFYQQKWFNEKFLLIKNILQKYNKRLDSRNTFHVKQVIPQEKNNTKKIDLNSLL